MALANLALESSLIAAFSLTSWLDIGPIKGTCSAMADAFYDYFSSGTITTAVTGVIPGTPPIPVSGVGKGNIIAPIPTTLAVQLIPTPPSNLLWAAYANQIAAELGIYLSLCSCSLTDTGTALGIGVGAPGSIIPAGQAALTSGLIYLFSSKLPWVTISGQVVELIKNFLLSCSVSTVDSGSNWAGSGVGVPGCIS